MIGSNGSGNGNGASAGRASAKSPMLLIHGFTGTPFLF